EERGERHRRDREDHHEAEQIDVERLIERRRERRHQREREPANAEHERAAPARHHEWPRAGNNPSGRKKRTAAISRESRLDTKVVRALVATGAAWTGVSAGR